MILTEEKKQHILASLAKDYVPFSDVFHEICADTVSDMMMSGALKTEAGKQDRLLLRDLETAYFELVPQRYREVLPVIEQVLSLQNKYHQLRLHS
ncbi:hypothetical protein A4G20_09795 [Pasteurellaceae bacterium RH1A]|nr:hypothetical protein A4G20_09795 [Pasteurellaceae bacterium RH1A]